jgi:hypothetical protein
VLGHASRGPDSVPRAVGLVQAVGRSKHALRRRIRSGVPCTDGLTEAGSRMKQIYRRRDCCDVPRAAGLVEAVGVGFVGTAAGSSTYANHCKTAVIAIVGTAAGSSNYASRFSFGGFSGPPRGSGPSQPGEELARREGRARPPPQ